MFRANKYGSFIKKNCLSSLLCLCVLLLQACGLPKEAGGSSGATSDDTNSGSQNTASGETPKFKGLILNVERLNGETVLGDSLSFVALTEDFLERVRSSNLPEFTIEYSNAADNTLLKITNIDYVEFINHVIKISYGSGETYYAPVPYMPAVDDETQVTTQVTVNVFTHYVVTKLFEKITSESELNDLQPCAGSEPLIGCKNQPRAKQIALGNIIKMASNFNIEFGSDTKLADAISSLETNHEFHLFVDRALDEILRKNDEDDVADASLTTAPFTRAIWRDTSSTALGIDPEGNPLITNIPLSKRYNSVYFGMGFSHTENSSEIKFSASNSNIDQSDNLQERLPAYPSYFTTTFFNEMFYEGSIAVDIPFERKVLTIGGLNNHSSNLSLSEDQTNSLESSSTFDSVLSTQGFLLDTRSLNQTIPGTGASQTKGWEFEPRFLEMYKVNEYLPPASISSTDIFNESPAYGNEPTWLSGSTHSTATVYNLSNTSGDAVRGGINEQLKNFSWELHSLETATDIDTSLFNNKQYGSISFGVKMNDNDKAIELIADIAQWAASSSTIVVTQPTPASAPDLYQSYHIALNEDGSVSTLQTERNSISNLRAINLLPQTVANTDHSGGTRDENRGLLTLDDGSEQPIGHITENGDYMAFSFNTGDVTADDDRGSGIIVATSIDDAPQPTDNQMFQLQGNAMTLSTSGNVLQNWNGSTLELNLSQTTNSQDCTATLNVERYQVTHHYTTDESSISGPTYESAASPATTSSVYNFVSNECLINPGNIQLGFTNVFGQDMKLKGFISTPGEEGNIPLSFGNMLTLVLIQDNTLGLLMGYREQSLNPDFD